jgi:hypothetical protein
MNKSIIGFKSPPVSASRRSAKETPFYGGNKFHSTHSNWNYKDRIQNIDWSQDLAFAMKKLNVRRLGGMRCSQKVKVLEPLQDSDDDGPELFTAQPSDDIPRNKLTEKLARGLQSYV